MYIIYNNDDDKKYIIDNMFIQDGALHIVGNDLKVSDKGFKLYNEEDVLLQDFSEYTEPYERSDKKVCFVKKKDLYSTFLLFDSNNFVYNQITCVNVKSIPNGYLYKSGYSKEYRYPDKLILFDNNNINLCKIVDGELVETTTEDKELISERISNEKKQEEFLKLEEAIRKKIDEINTACEHNITSGIDYNDEHFSYTISDQNNIFNTMQLAKMTGFKTPYHADNKSCKLYSYSDMMTIYALQEMNLTQHITYANQLKLYVKSLSSIEDIENVSYGNELTGEYLDTYNSIMEHSQGIFACVKGNKE